MTDHLTPFVISHYDVFETHILSRLNTPEIARARCPCGNEGAIPASFVGNLVCSQLNRTFRSLVPKYQDACESHERDEGRELPGEDEDANTASCNTAFQISLLLQTSVSIRKWLAPYAGHRCEMDISQCTNCKKFLCDYHHLARCKKCEAVALLCRRCMTLTGGTVLLDCHVTPNLLREHCYRCAHGVLKACARCHDTFFCDRCQQLVGSKHDPDELRLRTAHCGRAEAGFCQKCSYLLVVCDICRRRAYCDKCLEEDVSMSRCSRCGEWNCCEECLANEPTAKEWRAHVESCVGRRGGAKMTSTKTTTTS